MSTDMVAARVRLPGGFALSTALVLVGCLRPNPGFDGDAGDSAAATGASEGASAAASTTATVPTTGGTTAGSIGTSEAGTSGGETDGVSSSMSSGTGDATTGGPADCWDLGVDAWTVAPLVLDPPGGSPWLSPDALTLYWRAQLGLEWHVIRAARAGVDQPFPPGASYWPSLNFDADYPAFVDATQELFFAGSVDDIYLVPREGDAWGATAVAGGAMAFGVQRESHPNPTADGATLLFQRNDGPAFGQFDPGFKFYQLQRDVALGAPFPDVAPLEVTPADPGLGVVVCPALASDGLHLFFGGFDSEGGGLGDPNDGRGGVWYARRDAVSDASWLDVARSEQLREPGFVTCPASVSADGCHLTLILFVIGGGPYETRIARRG